MNDGGGVGLHDEDRLPWLEPAYADEREDEVSPLRLALLVLAGLVLVGLIAGGIYWVRNRAEQGGDGVLIAAPAGAYKVAAKDADAKRFQGEGDAAFAASEGVDRGGRIDPSRLPEAPVAATPVDASSGGDRAAAAAASNRMVAPVADRTGEKAGRPSSSPARSAHGPLIQLGSYGNQASARAAWNRLSKRFDYLADLPYSIEPVTIGGTNFYRLRASAGGQSGTLCGKLKVAGESCLVVN